MRTDVQTVEEIVEIENRDGRAASRAAPAELREAPVPTPLTEDELREVRRRHLAFKQMGRGRNSNVRPADDLAPLPVHPYMDVDGLRGNYPVCVFDNPAAGIEPLSRVIDGSLGSIELEGDDLERCRRWALQLEATIRRRIVEESNPSLLKFWNSCSEELSSQYRDDPGKQKKLHESLSALRSHLPSDARLVVCGSETAGLLLEAAWRRLEAKANGTTGHEIREAVRRLKDLITLEDEQSDSGLAPEHLQDAVGQGFQQDLDFEALSNLLHDAPHAESLSHSRRARIEAIVEILTGHLHRLENEGANIRFLSNPQSLTTFVRDQLAGESRVSRTMVAALLESAGRFDELRHSGLLAPDESSRLGQPPFGASSLPPVHIDFREPVSGSDLMMLAELFEREIPVRVLITVGDCVGGGKDDDSTPYLAVSLGERLLLGGPVTGFLSQRTLADTDGLIESMSAFLKCERTSILIVYDGESAGDRLHPYLRSAAGADSRAVPIFTYDAGRGSTWATRFSMEGNEQPERTWPVTPVDVGGTESTGASHDATFSAASLMLCHPAFSDHFGLIDRAEWHEDLTPVDEYAGIARQVPYLLAATDDGVVHRVILSDYAWRQTERIAERWRSLRELGGIANSHAVRAVDVAAERLDDEHRERLEELEAKHQSVLAATTGKLAEEIVSNIAAGLLGEASSGPLPAVSTPVSTGVTVSETKEEDLMEATEESGDETPAVDAPESEDDLEILDEAYVETPRCTTCDECTTINPRLFAYNENKQAYIADPTAGTYRELVLAAEKCPVRIIHPGKPLNPDEPHLDELVKRAEPFR